MDIADLVVGGINATHDLFKIGYGVYQDQRNYKYQKDLQKKIFNREDSAIQRRVADAQAAGINPYDAISAGSGAGATSAGGVSSTPIPDLNVGSWMDFSLAKQALLQQKEKTKQEKDLSTIVNLDKVMKMRQSALDNLAFAYQIGARADSWLPFNETYTHDGDDSWYHNPSVVLSDSPFFQILRSNTSNIVNNSEMIKKQNDWFTTNQVLDAINSGTGSIGNVASAFYGGFGSYRDYQGGKYFKAQRNYFEPEFTYPKHEMGFHP